jgi:hypothetical protein
MKYFPDNIQRERNGKLAEKMPGYLADRRNCRKSLLRE